MRKFLLLAVTAALALGMAQPGHAEAPAAEEQTLQDTVDSTHWSYRFLQDLASRGGLSRPFPSDGRPMSRAEMALYTANAADQVLGSDGPRVMLADVPALPPLPGEAPAAAPGYSAAPGDNDKVYLLVQQYQDELVKMGAKLKAIEDQLVALKEKNNDISNKLDKLLKMTGLRINGEAVVRSSNLLVNPKSGDATRVWPTLGYFDMKINAKPRPNMYAEAVFRMQTFFGAYWGSGNTQGVRRFLIQSDTPVAFKVGMLDCKNTPLTLWAQEDDFLYLNPVLEQKRKDAMDDRYLGDNRWPVNGLSADTTLVLFRAIDLQLSGMGTRLAVAGTKNSPLASAVVNPYDQYLYGGRAAIAITTNQPVFTWGFNYFEIREIADTAAVPVRIYGVQDDNVFSTDGTLALMKGVMKLKFEYATSNYNPNVDYGSVIDWTRGSAMVGHYLLDTEATKIDIYGLKNEQAFINYAAQTRIQDNMFDAMSPLIISNNMYNPSTNGYDFPGLMANRFAPRYNTVPVATGQGNVLSRTVDSSGGVHFMQPGGVYLSYDPTVNNTMPYGEATPNRMGGGLKYRGKYLKGFLQPSMEGAWFSENERSWYVGADQSLRTYTRYGGGLKFDLAALDTPQILHLSLWAGSIWEDSRSTWLSTVADPSLSGKNATALTSVQVDYGMNWEFIKKYHLVGGFRHQDWNGADYINTGLSGTDRYRWSSSNILTDSYCAGFNWEISASTLMGLSYAYHDVIYAKDDSANYGVQEFEAQMRVKF